MPARTFPRSAFCGRAAAMRATLPAAEMVEELRALGFYVTLRRDGAARAIVTTNRPGTRTLRAKQLLGEANLLWGIRPVHVG